MPDRTCSSSVWPLPETPAMPTISPARSSRLISSSSRTPRRVDQAEMLGLEHAPRRAAAAPCRAAGAPCGRPSARPAPRGRCRRSRALGHHLALAHDVDPVGRGHDLAQLVGDQHDRHAALLQGRRGCGTAGRSPAASAPRSARRGSGCARRGTAPSGSRPAAARRPTGRRPARRDRRSGRSRAPAAPAPPAPPPVPPASSGPPSAPSTTFSSTVKLSISMKCWCTMPMPWAMASRGLSICTALPSTRISPASAR